MNEIDQITKLERKVKQLSARVGNLSCEILLLKTRLDNFIPKDGPIIREIGFLQLRNLENPKIPEDDEI